MKFINLRSSSTPSELVSAISDNDFVNKNVNFGDSGIYPKMKVKEKNSRLSITCEMIGGPTRDNGFIVGTFFAGRIKKTNCVFVERNCMHSVKHMEALLDITCQYPGF